MEKLKEITAKEYSDLIHALSECDLKPKIANITTNIEEAIEVRKKYDLEVAKAAFYKATDWLGTYPWYPAVVEEFLKNLGESVDPDFSDVVPEDWEE